MSITTIDYYEPATFTAGKLYAGYNTLHGQAFAHGSTPHYLDSVKYYLTKGGSGILSGAMNAKLYACTGTPGSTGNVTGSALSISDTIDASTLGGYPGQWVEFYFSTPYLLSASTNYVVVLEFYDGDATAYVGFGYKDASPTHPGNHVQSSGADSTRDAVFYAYQNYDRYTQTKTVTETPIASLIKAIARKKTISITETPIASVSKVLAHQYTKTYSVVETPITSVSKVLAHQYTKTYSVIETPITSVSKTFMGVKNIIVVENPIVTRKKEIFVTKNITSTPISFIQIYNPNDPYQLRNRPNDFYRGDTVNIRAIIKDRKDGALINLIPNIAYDHTGNNNNGNVYGAIEKVGKLGIALQFNGINNWIETTNPSTALNGDLTIAVWIYRNTTGTRDGIISKHYSYEFDITSEPDNSVRFYLGDGTGFYDACSWSNITSLQQWIRLVFVRDNTAKTITLYKNGSLVDSKSYTKIVATGSYKISIGDRPGGTNIPFDGMICEPIITNTKWTQTDITNDYNSGSGKIYNEMTGFVAYWRFGSIVCQILDPNNIEKSSGIMTKDSTGIYSYKYIPGLYDPLGKWIIKIICTDYWGTNIETYPFYVLQP